MVNACVGISNLEVLTHREISRGPVNSELNTGDVALEFPVVIDIIAVFLQEIVL
jgi:hypothetical protein